MEKDKTFGFKISEVRSLPPDEPTDFFSKPSNFFLGTLPIDMFLELQRSDWRPGKVEPVVGVTANVRWTNANLLSEELENYNPLLLEKSPESGFFFNRDIPEVFHTVESLEKNGYFASLAEEMIDERNCGVIFVNNFTPKLTTRFPNYSTVIDYYKYTKKVHFINKGRDELIRVNVRPEEFSISVGEMRIDPENHEDPFNYLKLGNTTYFITNFQATWYPTDQRSVTHPKGDLNRQMQLLQESLDSLEEWFEQ